MAETIQSPREACISELHRIEEDSRFSSKSQFEAARSWRKLHLGLGLPTVILGAVAGVSAFSNFTRHTAWAGIFAILAAVLAASNTFLNPAERVASHQNFGNDYLSLRNRARFSATTEALALTDAELQEHVVALAAERDSLNKKAPQVHRMAFERARKGIEEGEAKYEVDRSSGT
jgi:hypothetical protein